MGGAAGGTAEHLPNQLLGARGGGQISCRGVEGSAPEVDTPTTAREGSFQPGPLCDGNAHNVLQRLPHRRIDIPGCLLDVARRGGSKDVGEFGVGET